MISKELFEQLRFAINVVVFMIVAFVTTGCVLRLLTSQEPDKMTTSTLFLFGAIICLQAALTMTNFLFVKNKED